METLFLIIGSWIAIALTICAWFLYLMITTPVDRAKNRPEDPQGLSTCLYCNADKCCMCDMGDDVECGNCDD